MLAIEMTSVCQPLSRNLTNDFESTSITITLVVDVKIRSFESYTNY